MTTKDWIKTISLILAVGIIGGMGWWIRYTDHASPQKLSLQPSSPTQKPPYEPCIIHISGWVAHPGVYEVAPRTRVMAALALAGGPLPGANLNTLNLAGFIKDGQRILVKPYPPPRTKKNTSQDEPITPTPANLPTQISLNQATLSDFRAIPGVTSTHAKHLLAYRKKHGFFRQKSDIFSVKGLPKPIAEIILEYSTL